jgi:hypothetical protein
MLHSVTKHFVYRTYPILGQVSCGSTQSHIEHLQPSSKFSKFADSLKVLNNHEQVSQKMSMQIKFSRQTSHRRQIVIVTLRVLNTITEI